MKLAALALLAAAALWLLRHVHPGDGESMFGPRLSADYLMTLPQSAFQRWMRGKGLRTVSDLQDGVDYLAEFRRERLPWERVG